MCTQYHSTNKGQFHVYQANILSKYVNEAQCNLIVITLQFKECVYSDKSKLIELFHFLHVV